MGALPQLVQRAPPGHILGFSRMYFSQRVSFCTSGFRTTYGNTRTSSFLSDTKAWGPTATARSRTGRHFHKHASRRYCKTLNVPHQICIPVNRERVLPCVLNENHLTTPAKIFFLHSVTSEIGLHVSELSFAGRHLTSMVIFILLRKHCSPHRTGMHHPVPVPQQRMLSTYDANQGFEWKE